MKGMFHTAHDFHKWARDWLAAMRGCGHSVQVSRVKRSIAEGEEVYGKIPEVMLV